MNSAEFNDDDEVKIIKNNLVKVETENEDEALDCSVTSRSPEKHSLDGLVTCLHDSNKRKQISLGCDGSGSQQEVLPSVKKRRFIQEGLISNMKNRDIGSPTQVNVEQPNKNKNPNITWLCEEEPFNDVTTPSYKKPLYGISHKITEKKSIPGAEQFSYELFEKVNPSSPSHLRSLSDQRKRDSAATITVTASTADSDPNIYSLIQKMFYTLNTLNSNMTQLHSKVDLLSLEVSRIKKHVSPTESVAEFRPPPEYQLTAAELKQIMDQSTSGGDLACRLLVQLFPELFSDDEFNRSCSTCGFLNKKKLESLHLQLIRNYVEVCYPSVKNNAVWQVECLPQVNDFFSRFWAQREMENSQQSVQSSSFYEAEQVESSHFIEDKEQEEALSLDRDNATTSDYVLDAQDLNEFLDEASSPGEFSVFLLHRLFPELFDHRNLAERYNCYGDSGKQELDPHRLQIIRRYTEIYFPDVQEEEAWLQQCAQRINDELESMYMDGSECEQMRDDCYDSSSLPDDVSIIKVEDSFEYERPGRRSKKIWLVPIDFDKLDIPPPDFDVPIPDYLLNKEQIKNIYESSLSIGNFASRLLVHLFPELFTHENLRKQYNCSGSLGKKQLDPTRIKLIRHYVQILYPRAKNDRVWTLEFVGKLDERCRRRDTEQRRTYQQQRKVHVPGPERREFLTYAINPERFREEFEGPPLPPERSSKDFCKIPLDELVVPSPDFPVPSLYMLSDKEVREIVQQSLSVGNFAARLLVRLFPELFTPENLRLQYNHSGACNKKQLDPTRLRLIRHYVEAVYPVEKMEEVWHYECIPSIDERCRRPNRKKCDILKKAKKAKK
ncbi:BEN domain-containing protein 3 [Dermochelys coriacea]|uniref:BEN domain-containing protein 3 n=1 Tax=Dermochelys coriacea TaxID=27794 RepID=UPI0018E8BF7E|nr:BEN domain-containing protein 3 [Dermochelys coriacea]XP_038253106.1 BEN domain-containing protein 3 [Dermochelys coriacea]XP_038253111.1 BEN domain-containing protein 3 [Dermochelys coriacea]XP_043366693.1 BEN domain-containing protein 3 [Dermochelys coriacea]XP_043366694.1 BEN domain-containing protein 3 [Dermochelys coriacea]XP_043366695.1 BEN domain-containing protein 3 [Dermochelys coriacea]XP_043366696.1 BEN domain-containing protein 3 [Dermochelys coriacea]